VGNDGANMADDIEADRDAVRAAAGEGVGMRAAGGSFAKDELRYERISFSLICGVLSGEY
jgi:hypothetical protein